MIVVAYFLTFACLILMAALFVHLKPPYRFYLAFSLQLAAVALAPCLIIVALLGAGLGALYHAPVAVGAGLLAAAIGAIYIAVLSPRSRVLTLPLARIGKAGSLLAGRPTC